MHQLHWVQDRARSVYVYYLRLVLQAFYFCLLLDFSKSTDILITCIGKSKVKYLPPEKKKALTWWLMPKNVLVFNFFFTKISVFCCLFELLENGFAQLAGVILKPHCIMHIDGKQLL